MEEKNRLDAELVRRGLFRSRETAKEAIKKGMITVGGKPVTRPSYPVSDAERIESGESPERFVGRGGYKLQKALDSFGIDLAGKRCLDLGASTGGFTDCMLQSGALSVAAVEGGHGQLASSLLSDPRVFSFEDTDVRRMPPEITGKSYDFIACDLSFISLKLVFPYVLPLLAEDGCAVFLVKPQFEAGRKAVGKKGVVRDGKDHVRVLEELIACLYAAGARVLGLTWSPIRGGEGNIEYLLQVTKSGSEFVPDVPGVVRSAHEELKRDV